MGLVLLAGSLEICQLTLWFNLQPCLAQRWLCTPMSVRWGSGSIVRASSSTYNEIRQNQNMNILRSRQLVTLGLNMVWDTHVYMYKCRTNIIHTYKYAIVIVKGLVVNRVFFISVSHRALELTSIYANSHDTERVWNRLCIYTELQNKRDFLKYHFLW